MVDVAKVLDKNGFDNISALISAANAVGLPIHIAVAFVEKESHGANIYGHDSGGTNYGAGQVTPQNYAKFYNDVVNLHKRSNGVGPMQITWPAFFVDAKRKGIDLSKPVENFTYGFKLIAGYLGGNYSRSSIANAGRRYNGASIYGSQVATRAAYWQGLLRPTTTKGTNTLRVGSTGNAVRSLQRGLNRVFPAYSKLTVDGDFGRATESVVIEFQTRSGLVPDGVVGLNTRAKLNAAGVTF